jgi:two-component system, LuxR family, response regulator FixJ
MMPEATPRKIAIVDDYAAVRESIRFLLEVAGHSVETFGSGAEFLAAGLANVACLILDHYMEQLNGLEVAEKLRLDVLGTPILLITALPSPAIRARAAILGIQKVLEKPFEEKDLLDFINASQS